MVGAAGGRHGAVRQGRDRAPSRRCAWRPTCAPGSRRRRPAGSAASSATRLEGRGAFALETISGEVPEELGAEERGGRHWVPFSQAAADVLLELRGARLDKRALRCATKLQVGLEPAGATLALVESVGEPRFTLDVNWDPDTIPAFLALPACEAHGRSLPLDPYLSSRSSTTCAPTPSTSAPNAAEALERLRVEHDAAIEGVRRSRAHDGPPLAVEARPGRRAQAVPARRGRLRARRPADVPRRRAGAGQDRPGARRAGGRRRLPGGRDLPRVAQAQLGARDAPLAPAPHARRRVGHRDRRARRRDHGHQLRHHPRAPRAARAAAPARARARRVALRQEPAREADAVGAPAGGVAPARGAAARPDRHAGDEPRRGADPAAADPRPARGLRLRRPLRPPVPGHRRRGADPLAPAPPLLRPPVQGRRAPAAPRQAPGRPSRSRSTTTGSTGWRRRT